MLEKYIGGSCEKSGREITVFDQGEGNNFWFELSGGSKRPGFEKLELRSIKGVFIQFLMNA